MTISRVCSQHGSVCCASGKPVFGSSVGEHVLKGLVVDLGSSPVRG